MKGHGLSIASVYNRYLDRGGEDVVFEAEAQLLGAHKHRVTCVTAQVKNPSGVREKAELAWGAVWSNKWYKRFRALLKDKSIDLVHVHNFFPNLSPSIYYACRDENVPVVQTLHNYRLLCPSATLYRNGHGCEDCMGKIPLWPSILHGCYHGSHAQASVIVAMLTAHRFIRTWQKRVSVYVALTEFARQKFIQGGLGAQKITVKPNFVHPDPGVRNEQGDYALFVGRLSAEKGIRTLLKTWACVGEIPLKIVGDGPLAHKAHSFVQGHRMKGVHILGRKDHHAVLGLMKGARFLVFPSEWYEGLPLTIVEAFACGVPVIASRLGAMAEIVQNERTGLHFTLGDPADLAAKIEWAWAHPEQMRQMGREARAEYERKYTAERNYQMLMGIYEKVLETG
jgi:glycosyltransferase involved in cell wall biosynthesis